MAVQDSLLEIVIASAVFAFAILLAIIVRILASQVHRIFGKSRRIQLVQRMVGVAWPSMFLLIVVQGVFGALAFISQIDSWWGQLRPAWIVVSITLVAFLIARPTNEFLLWYARRVSPRNRNRARMKLVPAIRRFAGLAIYVLAAILILDQLDISVSPLIAGLGVGGIAVALALQPTLSNFFAGTYLVSDSVISQGDFIELENGLTGYVNEIGWRSTRLSTPFNNLVVIPNNRLADSILLNYYAPTMAIGVLVQVGVSYESDLGEVERVAIEVANEVINEQPEAVKDFFPWFGYEKFGDSNIDFWVWVQSTDRIGGFKIKTELIKRIHSRFREEGIEINYPVRRLIFGDGERKLGL